MFPSIKEYHMFQVCTESLEEFKKILRRPAVLGTKKALGSGISGGGNFKYIYFFRHTQLDSAPLHHSYGIRLLYQDV